MPEGPADRPKSDAWGAPLRHTTEPFEDHEVPVAYAPQWPNGPEEAPKRVAADQDEAA
jgi:hypothetical protein